MMMHLRLAAAVLVISMLVVEVVLAYQVREQVLAGYSDFVSGYTAGQILQRGEADHLYDLQLQYAIQREVAPHVNIRHGALPASRPGQDCRGERGGQGRARANTTAAVFHDMPSHSRAEQRPRSLPAQKSGLPAVGTSASWSKLNRLFSAQACSGHSLRSRK